jgi:hypothetical protein
MIKSARLSCNVDIQTLVDRCPLFLLVASTLKFNYRHALYYVINQHRLLPDISNLNKKTRRILSEDQDEDPKDPYLAPSRCITLEDHDFVNDCNSSMDTYGIVRHRQL